MIKESLVVAEEREAKLDKLGDVVQVLEKHVNFAALAAALDRAAPRSSRERGGRPPFPTELMVRALILQQLYNLSDEQMEFQLLDRLSFQRFVGLRHNSQIRDRVAQMAVKLIIEPIFEADFCQNSYGFRPKKSAHDAMDDRADALQGYTNVIDAGLSKYFDSIPHAKLLTVVAERIVNSALRHVIKLWLKAPVIGEDKGGAKKNVGGGKANSKGTPQGGVISPLLANCYRHLLDRIGSRHQLHRKWRARIVR